MTGSDDVSNFEKIKAHYESCWNLKGKSFGWDAGPVNQLPLYFKVLVFPPTQERSMWCYATCGLSCRDKNVEFHLFSPVQSDSLIELLTVVAHYHWTESSLDLGHTVNFGRSWLPGSKCDRGLISLPYLDGPELEWLSLKGQRIRFLWLIPITKAEREYKIVQGLESLENRLEEAGFNYLDPHRNSVV